MRRAAWWINAVVAVAASGCLNPDDIFPVHGSIASGAAGVPITVTRSEGFGVCEGGQRVKALRSDDAGQFQFELLRAQAINFARSTPYCFRVQAEFPSGARAWVDVPFIGEELTLPPLVEWDAQPQLVDGGWVLAPVLPDEAARADAGAGVVRRFEALLDDGGVVWRQDDQLTLFDAKVPWPLQFDPRLVEDFATTARFRAVVPPLPVTDADPLGGRQVFSLFVEAAQRPSLEQAGAPFSRDAGSPLTDGVLSAVDWGLSEQLSLDLVSPVDAGLLVLRDVVAFAPTFTVQAWDVDGGAVTFASLAGPTTEPQFVLPVNLQDPFGASVRGDAVVAPGTWVAVPLVGQQPVQRLRLRFSGGVQSIAEVSVY